MCGFIFYYNKTDINGKDEKKLKSISSLIKHRGPDYKKIFKKKKYLPAIIDYQFKILIKDQINPFFQRIRDTCFYIMAKFIILKK